VLLSQRLSAHALSKRRGLTKASTEHRRHAGYNNRMDTTKVIETFDAKIGRLERARALLNGHTAPVKRGRPIGSNATTKPSRRKMSAEGRARIVAAQKARWAKVKKGWALNTGEYGLTRLKAGQLYCALPLNASNH
jgi:hypothetical protein